MKKIFLALAAVAALASCVDEKNIAPEQTGDNLVTIKALATKTTLNGTDVVWEADDAIKVVLDYAEDELQDFTMSSHSGSTASFTGTFAKEVTADYAFAVYPNSAVVVESEGTRIKHTLPADQSAGITSGMNLSFADLDVEALAVGNATTIFENALALVKVIIPEDVKSVSLTSNRDALVGDVVYQFNSEYGVYRTGSPSGKTVSLTKAEGLPTDNSILVYPGNAGVLTLEMVGLDGTTYTKTTANEIHFTASEYRTINLANLFNMDVADVKIVSPMGETFAFDIVAAQQYEYKVAIEDDPTWITLNLTDHVTKAFVGTKVSFTVDANTTGSPRNANVTITWKDGEEQKKFKITQESAYLDFVYVDPADPASGLIQWEETFGVYANDSDATAEKTYKNVFTIELSDDFSKGTYKVKNIFVYNDKYTGNVAGTYYANYEDGTFTIIKNDSGYPFTNNTVALTYNEVEKIFTASSPIQFGYKYSANYLQSGGFIKEYTAAVKVDDPGAGGDEGSISGDWNQIVTFGSSSTVKTGASASVTVSVSGDQVTLENFVFSGCTATGTLSEKTITISAANADLPTTYGPVDNDIVITLSDDMKTMTASNITTGYGYGIVVDSWTAELP